jgi:hypothetical protein
MHSVRKFRYVWLSKSLENGESGKHHQNYVAGKYDVRKS